MIGEFRQLNVGKMGELSRPFYWCSRNGGFPRYEMRFAAGVKHNPEGGAIPLLGCHGVGDLQDILEVVNLSVSMPFRE